MDNKIALSSKQTEFLLKIFPDLEINKCKIEIAGQAASQRTFLRVFWKGNSFIIVLWDSKDEDWQRFISIASNRKVTSFLLPEIFGFDSENGFILEEDLGNLTLKKYCQNLKDKKDKIVDIYLKAIDALCLWQSPQTSTIECINQRSMDLETFLWESSYFARYCVYQYCQVEDLLNKEWEKERKIIAEKCASFEKSVIHRDFQSENILLSNNKIRFVDFQGARLGPPQYDVASLIFDPYVSLFSDEEIEKIYNYYCEKSKRKDEKFEMLYFCALQRLMQASGAYANLSLNKNKKWYEEFLPISLLRLKKIAESLKIFPAIIDITNKCLENMGR
ncbi:MAG: phosphotransferase [Chitinispirillaceae bacterium]|nr:phosphotransferase [Chitinispirillaceae bacterium]